MLETSKLKNTPTLWLTFSATVLITLIFPVLSNHFELTLIDGVSDPEQVRNILSNLSAEQKSAHAWITGTLDVAYPLAYGCLFAGVALHFFPVVGKYIAPVALLAIPVDLFEGFVQILALTDIADWLALKAFVTPLKLMLFFVGLFCATAGWIKWVYLRFSASGGSK